MTKFKIVLIGISAFCMALPASAQGYDYDYSGLVPFRTTDSNDGLQTRTIESIYMNPLNNSRAKTRNGLPPVTTDSFVYEAGGMAELIYGDEGVDKIPPYFNFTPEHRIEAGIAGTRAAGLTVGKSSPLPSTWGGDEFCMPEPLQSHGATLNSSPQIIFDLTPNGPVLEYR